MVDCAGAYDNFGCDGGLPSHAFEYIYNNGGLATEEEYAYKGVDEKCYYESGMASVGTSLGPYNITTGDEEELRQHLY